MVQVRTIVGIGEAMLSVGPAGEAAVGLAAETALSAVRLQQRAVAISRVGQDAAGTKLVSMLADAGVDVDHIQSDPDLPTGRHRVQRLGDAVRTTIDSHAAFDNLQWDFDLEDVAQRTDAAFFGLVALRSGQSSSEMKRFLGEARGALRVFDLTSLERDVQVSRSAVQSIMEVANGAVVDETVLRAILPTAQPADCADATRLVAQSFELDIVMWVSRSEASETIEIRVGDEYIRCESAFPAELHSLMSVYVVQQLLSGTRLSELVTRMPNVARHAADDSSARIPDELLQ